MPYPKSEHMAYTPVSHSDINFFITYLADPAHTRYLPNRAPYPSGLAVEWAAKRIWHWEKQNFGTYVLRYQKTGEKIGFCGLEHARNTRFIDIRYGLTQKNWGKGLAFEAAAALVDHGFFCLDLDIIYGAAVSGNTSSVAILQKIGMTPDPAFDTYGDAVDPFSIKRDAY